MIINKKYNRDIEFERSMHNRYLSECVQKQNQINELKIELELAKAKKKALRESLDEYKQKYLDEQHKRLLLAEKVEQLETKLNDAERCGYTDD